MSFEHLFKDSPGKDRSNGKPTIVKPATKVMTTYEKIMAEYQRFVNVQEHFEVRKEEILNFEKDPAARKRKLNGADRAMRRKKALHQQKMNELLEQYAKENGTPIVKKGDQNG